MPQYAFEIIETRTGVRHTVWCRAPREYWAYLQVAVKYTPQYHVNLTATEERGAEYPPILGAINASDMRERDVDYLERCLLRQMMTKQQAS